MKSQLLTNQNNFDYIERYKYQQIEVKTTLRKSYKTIPNNCELTAKTFFGDIKKFCRESRVNYTGKLKYNEAGEVYVKDFISDNKFRLIND